MSSEDDGLLANVEMNVLIATRHVVGMFLVMLLQRPVVMGPDRLLNWFTGTLVALVVGGLIAGLAALFFTKTQAKHSAVNFIMATWFVVFILLLEQWDVWRMLRA
jgi:hypothetical protein